MILDLDRLSSAEERVAGDEVVRFRDAAGDQKSIDCRVDLGVRCIGETFYIDGEVTGTLMALCDLCLEAVRVHLSSSFNLVVRRAVPGERDADPTDSGEYIELPAGRAQLALDQVIHESLVVDVPMKVVCSDGCRGLCPGCGCNLNRDKCACDSARDPRWDGLRKLGSAANESKRNTRE